MTSFETLYFVLKVLVHFLLKLIHLIFIPLSYFFNLVFASLHNSLDFRLQISEHFGIYLLCFTFFPLFPFLLFLFNPLLFALLEQLLELFLGFFFGLFELLLPGNELKPFRVLHLLFLNEFFDCLEVDYDSVFVVGLLGLPLPPVLVLVLFNDCPLGVLLGFEGELERLQVGFLQVYFSLHLLALVHKFGQLRLLLHQLPGQLDVLQVLLVQGLVIVGASPPFR